METHILPNILVVGEDDSISKALSDIRCHVSTSAEPAQSVAEPSNSGCYEIVIVDLQRLDEARVALIEKNISNCPYAKTIGIKPPGAQNGQPNQEVNFFRCFEKPLDPESLSNAVRYALEIQAKEQIISEMAQKLEVRTNELADQRLQFEFRDQKLLRNSGALSVLAEDRQREREQVEKRVAVNLRSIIIPSIDKLKKVEALEPYSLEFDLIISQIEAITSDSGIDAKIVSKLTPAELRVATLIGKGLNTGEIARKLNIALDTIKSHRKRIRKKLGINKAGYSLKNFLETKVGGYGKNRSAVIADTTRPS